MASRQLDLFSSPADVALQPLGVTPLPDVGSLIERIGRDEDWQEQTLSEVLELWPCLYDEYVHILLEPRKQAEEWFKQNGTHYALCDRQPSHPPALPARACRPDGHKKPVSFHPVWVV